MKVLAVGAHPDDIEIFMYGFLMKCKKINHDISLIVVTDGSLGGNNEGQNLKNIRKEEAIRGLSDLGKPIFLDFPDGHLSFEGNYLSYIRKTIKNINPDLVITHDAKDYHSDHRVVSDYVKMSVGHFVPILNCDTMMGINFNPNYYIDISTEFSSKLNAILEHKSQNPKRFVSLAKLMNSFRSAQCNLPLGTYAEAYRFERSFPFSDISSILPPSPKTIPFHSTKKNGFL